MKSPDWTKRYFLTVSLLLSLLAGAVAARADDFGISRRSPAYSQSLPYQRPMPAAPYSPNPTGALPESGPAPALAAPAAPKVASQAAAPVTSDSAVQGAAPLPNVVRLVAFDPSGQSFGSGAYIGNYGEYGLILSNWHVVCEADGLVHMHFSNGFSSYGAILTADKKWDLALIAISRPPQSVPLLPVARYVPKPGESLWIAGYGSGDYRLAGGRCIRYLAPEIPSDGSAPLYEIIELSVSARKGDSGGPILNANGELAGVLFGSDMVRNTAGSGCERVNRFLSQAHPALAKLTTRPEDFFHSIEKNGPRRQLTESRGSAVPEPVVELPQRRMADFAGSSSQFGVRSGSRRYAQPAAPAQASANGQPLPAARPSTPTVSVPETGIPPQPTQPVQQLPLSRHGRSTPDRVQTALWKSASETDPTIRQTGHQAPLNPLATRTVSDPSSSERTESVPKISRYETVSQRNDTVPKMFSLGGILFAVLLVSMAVPLLKSDRRNSPDR